MVDCKKIHANQPRFARPSEGHAKVDVSKRGNWEKHGCFLVKNGGVGGSEMPMEIRRWKTRGHKSYAATVLEGGGSEHIRVLSFDSDPDDIKRWSKAFIGEVIFSSETYNLQTHFEIEGFFAVKIISLGAKLCILEELEEGVISELLSEDNTWWKQWFSNIIPWSKGAVDSERVTWVRVHGVPCHVWKVDFFETLANTFGKFISRDMNFKEGFNMDVARFLIRVPLNFFWWKGFQLP